MQAGFLEADMKLRVKSWGSGEFPIAFIIYACKCIEAIENCRGDEGT